MGKVVAITGAANGLGKALAYEFSEHQASIVAVDVDTVGLASLQNELPDVVTIKADITQSNDLKMVLGDTLKIYGQLDVWVNNAGILVADGPALEQDMDDVRRIFDINTLALIDGSIQAGHHLKNQREGWIINVLSSTVLEASPNRGIYSATKHAGHGFTRALKAELQDVNILAVYPQGIKTELFGDTGEPNNDDFMTSEHVAKLIVGAVLDDQSQDLIIKR